jgi:hypothetical protein
MKFKLLLILSLIINLNLKTQSISDLLKEKYTDVEFNELLGKGGTGEIWGSKDSNLAIKGGNTSSQCQRINKEYKIQNNFYDAVKNYDNDLLNRVIILKPNKIIKNGESDVCGMEISRLYPIKEEPNKKLITQLRLGENDFDLIEKADEEIIKGHTIGLKQFIEIVEKYPKTTNKKNIEQGYIDIGKALGILHFKLKLDGLDSELSLVRKTPEENKYYLAFLDFGMCNDISKYFEKNKNDKIIKYIIEAFLVEPIFPNPTTPEFKLFAEEYIKVAKTEKQTELAQQIIFNFIGKQFLNNKILTNFLLTKLRTTNHNSFQLKRLTPVLYEWTKAKLIKYIVDNDYNVSSKNINIYLEKILTKIIENKKLNSKNLSRYEKILLQKLEK